MSTDCPHNSSISQSVACLSCSLHPGRTDQGSGASCLLPWANCPYKGCLSIAVAILWLFFSFCSCSIACSASHSLTGQHNHACVAFGVLPACLLSSIKPDGPKWQSRPGVVSSACMLQWVHLHPYSNVVKFTMCYAERLTLHSTLLLYSAPQLLCSVCSAQHV